MKVGKHHPETAPRQSQLSWSVAGGETVGGGEAESRHTLSVAFVACQRIIKERARRAKTIVDSGQDLILGYGQSPSHSLNKTLSFLSLLLTADINEEEQMKRQFITDSNT
jgi:hypothetical protein